ncbi:MAG: uroporphyrinogen decarboxylase [Myxococcota bacterium]
MSAFLSACRREPVDHTPIWIMRQAGRYQPEYRELRSKVSFLELCKTPELAAQVTLQAVEQLGVDAGIIFADILLILEPLGVGFEFAKDHGPRIHHPVRTAAQVDALPEQIDAGASLSFVMDAIRLVKREIKVPLIGFCGAPFTLASYVIEGRGTKNYYETKRLMYGDPGLWNALMTKLVDALVGYLQAQIDAGADAVQVFDSWVGCLGPQDYRRYIQPHMHRLFAALPKSTPSIHFGTGNPSLYPLMKEAGGDVVGLDWRVDLGETWTALGKDEVAVMGNLDPASLLAPRPVMKQRAQQILESAGGVPGHIFNLGHGIMPEAEVAAAQELIAYVHEASAGLKTPA